jgi:TonB family protein
VNPWEILGLPPGADRDAIRRAYARALKGVNPEDDPEGFMALRAAHDAALNQLKWRQQWPDEDDADDVAANVPPPEPAAPAPAPVADDPAAAALQAELAADRADLIARQQALIDAITAGPDQPRQHRALDDLLAAPALIDIAARDRIEPWVAAVLAHHLPDSDPLVVHAIERFGWSDLPPGQRSADIDQLLRRREEGEFVVEMARRHTPLHQGYVALSTPPGPRWWRHLKALLSAEPAQTRQILGLIDGPLPGIADWLNADAIAAWRAWHAVPRLRLWMIITMIPLASVLWVPVSEQSGWPDAAQAVLSLLAFASPWGLLWLLRRRAAWQAEWDRPDFHYHGWPLAVIALPLLAALWPTVPALAPLYLVPLVVAAGWTMLAVDRLQPDGWRDFAPGLIRAMPAFLFLLLMVGGAPAADGLGPIRALAIFGVAFGWWQGGDQMMWTLRNLLARRSDRLGGALAPWVMLGVAVVTAGLAAGLALVDQGLVGRGLGLLVLPLLASLLALRMAAGWVQLAPLAVLAGLALLTFELLSLIDPSIKGATGIVGALRDTSWLIDPRTGLPRAGLIFFLVFGATSLWRGLRGQAGGGGDWLIRFVVLAVGVAFLVSIWDRPEADRQPPPPAKHGGKWQPARPDGDTSGWVDLGAVQPPPPMGDYRYEVRLAVGPQGRVLLCSVSSSTGLATLDAAICPQLKAKARFKPGLNDEGQPMPTVEFLSGRLRRIAPATAPVASPPVPPPPVRCPDSRVTGPMVAEPCMADRWFYDGSYPQAARLAGHSGTVGYVLEVGRDGRVESCRIDDSSGHASLDRGTCALLMARARFVPAQDVDGSPMPWTYRGAIEWQLRRR